MKAARSDGVACRRRGNHASGTPMVRPSDRSTHMDASSKRTDSAEMVMPCLNELLLAKLYHFHDLSQFGGAETVAVVKHCIGFKPDFGNSRSFAHMDVNGFARVALVGKVEEGKTVLAVNGRHFCVSRRICPEFPPGRSLLLNVA